MSQEESQGSRTRRSQASDDVLDLAAQAITAVAHHRENSQQHVMQQHLTQRLFNAIMDRSAETGREVAASLVEAGIPPEAVADIYVPEAARLMGVEWENDSADFAQVTMGSARLQSILRDLDEVWDAGHSGTGLDRRPAVLVLTIAETQHTLGASVLATQLRRMGCSVHICAGELGEMPNTPFDAVFVSASVADGIDRVSHLIKTLRAKRSNENYAVILGGTILEGIADAGSKVGADFATRDAMAALRFCKLTGTGQTHHADE